jgi:hypothetical protein
LGGKRLADSQAMDELPYDGLILFNQSALMIADKGL